MENASASAAPAPNAGPSDGQDSTPNGNSAVDRQDTARSERGAASSESPKKQSKPAAKPAEDDPEWDFGDGQKRKRSEVKKRLSEIQTGAQKAWAERQEFEKKLNAKIERLQKLGFDPEAFENDPDREFERVAHAALARKLEESTRDPRELAAEQAERERDEYKRQLDEHNEQKRKQEYQTQVDAHADTIATHFATALKEHNLPANPKAVWLMASLAQAARKSGEQISLSELARRTNEMIDGDLNHYLPEEDGAGLAKRLGDKRVEALRKHLLSEHQSKFQQPQTTQRSAQPKVMTSNRHPNGYITFDEMLTASKRR